MALRNGSALQGRFFVDLLPIDEHLNPGHNGPNYPPRIFLIGRAIATLNVRCLTSYCFANSFFTSYLHA